MWKRIYSQSAFADMPNPIATQTLPSGGIISSSSNSLVGQKGRVYTALVFTTAGVPVTGVDTGTYDVLMWQQCIETGAATVYCGTPLVVGAVGYESVPWYDIDEIISAMKQQYIYTGVSVCNIVAPAAADGFYILARGA